MTLILRWTAVDIWSRERGDPPLDSKGFRLGACSQLQPTATTNFSGEHCGQLCPGTLPCQKNQLEQNLLTVMTVLMPEATACRVEQT